MKSCCTRSQVHEVSARVYACLCVCVCDHVRREREAAAENLRHVRNELAVSSWRGGGGTYPAVPVPVLASAAHADSGPAGATSAVTGGVRDAVASLQSLVLQPLQVGVLGAA
jgi:hypothetical protein